MQDLMPFILIILTVVIALISSLKKLKPDVRVPGWWKALTFWGYILIIASTMYLSLSIYDIAKTAKEKKESDRKTDSLLNIVNLQSRQLSTYENLLVSIGLKLDKNDRNAKLNIDSLTSVIKGQAGKIIPSIPRMELCYGVFPITKVNTDTFSMAVKMCFFDGAIHDVAVWVSMIAKKDKSYETLTPLARIASFRRAYTPGAWVETTLRPYGSDLNYSLQHDTVFCYIKGAYRDNRNKDFTLKTFLVALPGSNVFHPLNDDYLPPIRAYLTRIKVY
jgi:hypothetical protein